MFITTDVKVFNETIAIEQQIKDFLEMKWQV
jgi:hypothetical protein